MPVRSTPSPPETWTSTAWTGSGSFVCFGGTFFFFCGGAPAVVSEGRTNEK